MDESSIVSVGQYLANNQSQTAMVGHGGHHAALDCPADRWQTIRCEQVVMAQQHADSPEAIYQALTGDEDFMELVGKVIFSGGAELDAISIVSPGAPIPKVQSASGMEVVIHDISDLGRREYITDDIDITTTWKVFLIGWPGATGATLDAAARRIMEIFNKATTIETNPTPQGLGAMIQLLALIPSDSVVTIPLEA